MATKRRATRRRGEGRHVTPPEQNVLLAGTRAMIVEFYGSEQTARRRWAEVRDRWPYSTGGRRCSAFWLLTPGVPEELRLSRGDVNEGYFIDDPEWFAREFEAHEQLEEARLRWLLDTGALSDEELAVVVTNDRFPDVRTEAMEQLVNGQPKGAR